MFHVILSIYQVGNFFAPGHLASAIDSSPLVVRHNDDIIIHSCPSTEFLSLSPSLASPLALPRYLFHRKKCKREFKIVEVDGVDGRGPAHLGRTSTPHFVIYGFFAFDDVSIISLSNRGEKPMGCDGWLL